MVSERSKILSPIAFAINIALVYVAYLMCRVVYIVENWAVFGSSLIENPFLDLCAGSLKFDTSAILYTNALYAIMMLFPIHYKEEKVWQIAAKWLYMVINSIAIVMNLADSVYFRYTGKRTTMTIMQEFEHESNIGSILRIELLNHWYLFLLGISMILLLYCCYVMPRGHSRLVGVKDYLRYYLVNTILFVLYIPLTVAGMRGGFTTAVRPITISNANQYVNSPTEAAAILNTPFSLIRTIGKNVFKDPGYYSQHELDKLYSPVHVPTEGALVRKKNVVILIVESFGREYIGEYNRYLENGQYKGYAPFIDSLLRKSLTFNLTLANGRQSIDGMPSILSSIPRFIEPFFLTPASMNDVSGIAGELGKWGYTSAFFHGAENGSMGFQAFAKTTGYKKYYGRNEFNEDNRFRGNEDFDGTWAIWDEPFLQFFALKMSEMKEPFITTVFTASSHHPYVVPEQYRDIYKDEDGNPIHKCIRYTDMALSKFFETASKQPWYDNTIFVFTSDHTNLSDHDEYRTDLGYYMAPLFFYDPSGEIPRGIREGIAQQIDIMPTILNFLGYPNPYVAFGIDIFNTPKEEQWAVIYLNGTYQFVKGDYLIHFDGCKIIAAYNYKKDILLQRNLVRDRRYFVWFKNMEKQLKAIIQSYMQRMTDNALIVK